MKWRKTEKKKKKKKKKKKRLDKEALCERLTIKAISRWVIMSFSGSLFVLSLKTSFVKK